ncbi:MAG: hypothetical protein QOG13_944 [Sphingomonadales bacterium]|jgi:hypothetical protein|nr:hypothetical protein [Sphingomonadales bacterium]
MRIAALGFLIFTAATPPPPPFFSYADRAGNRIEALASAEDPAADVAAEYRSPVLCGRDGPCALLRRDGESGQWRLHLFESRPGPDAVAARPLLVPESRDGEETLALWPHLVREAGGALLIGVLRSRSTGFSGGGASATRLTLMRFEPGSPALAPVLEAPLGGSAMIRACFGPRDERNRAGACHDQYELQADLTLDASTSAGRPRFLLTARARTYPGRLDRNEDSTTRPPLSRRDLVWAADPQCTYARTFAFDAGAGGYAPDSALPDCGQYLDF